MTVVWVLRITVNINGLLLTVKSGFIPSYCLNPLQMTGLELKLGVVTPAQPRCAALGAGQLKEAVFSPQALPTSPPKSDL